MLFRSPCQEKHNGSDANGKPRELTLTARWTAGGPFGSAGASPSRRGMVAPLGRAILHAGVQKTSSYHAPHFTLSRVFLSTRHTRPHPLKNIRAMHHDKMFVPRLKPRRPILVLGGIPARETGSQPVGLARSLQSAASTPLALSPRPRCDNRHIR